MTAARARRRQERSSRDWVQRYGTPAATSAAVIAATPSRRACRCRAYATASAARIRRCEPAKWAVIFPSSIRRTTKVRDNSRSSATSCQGEGRGFESRLPLHTFTQQAPFRGCLLRSWDLFCPSIRRFVPLSCHFEKHCRAPRGICRTKVVKAGTDEVAAFECRQPDPFAEVAPTHRSAVWTMSPLRTQ